MNAAPDPVGVAMSDRHEHGIAGAAVETTIIDPFDVPAWDREVVAHPSSTFFHSSAWARVLVKAYGHHPLYLRFSCAEQLLGLVPLMEVKSRWTGRRGVTLPFTDSCEPLLFLESARRGIFEKLSEMGRNRGWQSLQFRGGPPPDDLARPSLSFYRHVLDLRAGPEQLFTEVESSVRRAIRKAERNGLTIAVELTIEAVRDFYRLHCLTRRRHGAPPQPWRFFQAIFEEVISTGAGFVVLARTESAPIAASVFVKCGKKAVYKFGASDEERQDLRGNNRVMWEGIKTLAAGGCETLDFGRTSVQNTGLRRFKLGWGAAEELIHYYKADPASGEWLNERDKSTGIHTTIFQKLPVALNRLAGAVLYPHLD